MRTIAGAACLILAACAPGTEPGNPPKAEPPARVSKPGKEADLATITLTAEAVARLGIQTAAVERKSLPRSRIYAGEVVAPPGSILTVSAPLAGTVRGPKDGYVPAAGEPVAAGRSLARIEPLLPPESALTLASAKVAHEGTRAAIERARVEAEAAADRALAEERALQPILARAETLVEENAGSVKAADEARARVIAARAAKESARRLAEALRGFALPEIEAGAPPALDLPSPITGTCTRVFAGAGQIVASGAPLLEIQGLDRLWVRVPVPVGDLAAIDPKAPAAIGADGPAAPAPVAEPIDAPPAADFRAATVDLHFGLPGGGSFRPGQRVEARLALAGTAESLAVPAAAVLYDIHGGAWVYEALGPASFARRRIVIRRVAGGIAALESGPPPGTAVVTAGAAELFGTEFGIGK